MCGILRLASFGSMARTSPPIQSSPSVALELETAARHELHADADAEERPALDAHRVFQRLAHARHGFEAALAVGEGADARQHDTVGGGDDPRALP